MSTLTDHLRAGAYIAWEPESISGIYTRETGTLVSGQKLNAGTVVMDNGAGKLTALTAVGTAGDLDGTVLGILFADVDATSADQPAVYTARLTAVRGSDLIYPTESTGGGEKASTNTALTALGIIVR